MYPDNVATDYPTKLCNHLAKRFGMQSKERIKFLELGCGNGSHLKIFSRMLDGDFLRRRFEVFGKKIHQ